MLSRSLTRSVLIGTCALGFLLAGCGGSDSAATATATDPAPATAAPFISVAQSSAVGAAGGSVSLTAADGTQYTLDVPTGALATTTTLSLTTAAPATGQRFRVVAGPDGLLFKSGSPATLTIRPPSGRELPTTAGLLYSGSPVSSTRNADGSIAMKLYQLRGSATPTTALAQLAQLSQLSQALTRLLPAEAVDNSVLVCRSPNVNGGPAAGIASYDQLDFERFVSCTYDQIDDLIAASDFNTALALAQLLESMAQRNNTESERFAATAKSLACTGRQRSLDTLTTILIQSPEDVLVIESVAYWDMMVQKLGGGPCAGQPSLMDAVQPKIEDALTLLDADFATAAAAAIDSTNYTRRKTTAVKTITLRERLLTISVALGIPPAPVTPAAVRETPQAAESPYTAANIATTQVQGRLEPSMLKNLLPAPWSRCRTAGDYMPLLALMEQFSGPNTVKSAAQYCATQLSVEVQDNQLQPTSSISGLGGVSVSQTQTTATVAATVDGVLRLTGPIGALSCPAGVAVSEQLVVRFAGVEALRQTAAPYLASSMSLNISQLRTAAGLAASDARLQLLTIERAGEPCSGYWGEAPAPLIAVTVSVISGCPRGQALQDGLCVTQHIHWSGQYADYYDNQSSAITRTSDPATLDIVRLNDSEDDLALNLYYSNGSVGTKLRIRAIVTASSIQGQVTSGQKCGSYNCTDTDYYNGKEVAWTIGANGILDRTLLQYYDHAALLGYNCNTSGSCTNILGPRSRYWRFQFHR
jgi:hypothetical protein